MLALVSAKHAPGVTTAAVALAAAAATETQPIVVELDSAGGDIAARCGLPLEPGLITLAAAGRHPGSRLDLFRHAQPLPAGGWVVACPPSPERAAPAIAAVARRLDSGLELARSVLIVDCGRWSQGSSATPVVETASAVLLVVEPTVPGVEHARARLDAITATSSGRVALVVAGDRPYPPGEVAEALGLPVVGVIAQDGRGVAAVYGAAVPAGVRRSHLVRSARSTLEAVAELVELPVGVAS